jgi:ATP-dependent Lon protease
VVGFDEVPDLEKMPKEVIATLKTFCESGQFQRGQEAMTGYVSIAMFGNTQHPIEVIYGDVKTAAFKALGVA